MNNKEKEFKYQLKLKIKNYEIANICIEALALLVILNHTASLIIGFIGVIPIQIAWSKNNHHMQPLMWVGLIMGLIAILF